VFYKSFRGTKTCFFITLLCGAALLFLGGCEDRVPKRKGCTNVAVQPVHNPLR
jgi:hypothetical protein